jgi:hypothetical protein
MGIVKNLVEKFQRFLCDERGSLSLLIMSLFMTIVITLLILTDISSIYFAKRALTQATEAAAQRGVRNLDLEAYYRGEYNASRLALNLLGNSEVDPGIPIDCAKGSRDAFDTLKNWGNAQVFISRGNLGAIAIDEIQCDGYQLSIRTSSMATLPFVLPFIGLGKVRISAQVGIYDERKVTTNYYGLNLG